MKLIRAWKSRVVKRTCNRCPSLRLPPCPGSNPTSPHKARHARPQFEPRTLGLQGLGRNPEQQEPRNNSIRAGHSFAGLNVKPSLNTEREIARFVGSRYRPSGAHCGATWPERIDEPGRRHPRRSPGSRRISVPALTIARWALVSGLDFLSVPPSPMLSPFHVSMETCKHEIADGLICLKRSALDRFDFRIPGYSGFAGAPVCWQVVPSLCGFCTAGMSGTRKRSSTRG